MCVLIRITHQDDDGIYITHQYHAHSHTQILSTFWKNLEKRFRAIDRESRILLLRVWKCVYWLFFQNNNRMMVREVLFPFWSRAWRAILRCWSTCGTITSCWRAWRRTIVIVIWSWRMWRRCGQRPRQERERRQSTKNVLSAKCFSEVTPSFSSFVIPLHNSTFLLLYILPNN